MRMANYVRGILVAAVILLLVNGPLAVAQAEEPEIEPAYPGIDLAEMLDAVASRTDKRFIVDADAHGRVTPGQLRPRDIDIAALHTLLSANGLAAIDRGDLVRVLPVARIRQHPLPAVGDTDRTYAPDEWVTHTVRVRNVSAVSLIPLLRPLMPRPGHLAAEQDSETILIVDRYANALRIAGLIRSFDNDAGSGPG